MFSCNPSSTHSLAPSPWHAQRTETSQPLMSHGDFHHSISAETSHKAYKWQNYPGKAALPFGKKKGYYPPNMVPLRKLFRGRMGSPLPGVAPQFTGPRGFWIPQYSVWVLPWLLAEFTCSRRHRSQQGWFHTRKPKN